MLAYPPPPPDFERTKSGLYVPTPRPPVLPYTLGIIGAGKLAYRQAAAGGGGGGVVVADSLVGGGTGGAPGNVTLTLPGGAPSVGEVLVVGVGANSGSDATKPASGQGGVTTWNELISTVRRSSQIWYGVVDGTPSASVVYNNNFRLIGYHALLRVQGLDTASLVHGTPLAADNQARFITAGSFTPTGGAHVWLLTNCATSTGGTPGGISSSTPSGWTELHTTTFGPLAYVEVASASGSYDLTWDSQSAFRAWDAQLVAFNVA